jgi:hypothetical protein
MKKTAILTLSLAFLGMLPVAGQEFFDFSEEGNQSIGQLWNDFQSYAADIQTYLELNLSNTVRQEESQEIINNSSGELNIPNPIEAEYLVRNEIIEEGRPLLDPFENNPQMQVRLAANEINRQITRSAVAGVLGEEAQLRMKGKLESLDSSLEKVNSFASQARELEQSTCESLLSDLLSKITEAVGQLPTGGGDTQQTNVAAALLAPSTTCLRLRDIVIQTEQTKMMAENLASTIQVQQSLQYTNLNLANIAQQMEETNRARRVDSATEAARLLRTTTQADLLGVRNRQSANSIQQPENILQRPE